MPFVLSDYDLACAPTTATRNTFEAGGRPPTFEMVYEMLDKIEWTLDENGELSEPSLVMHPDTASKLPQPTPLGALGG